eukprot:GFUD01074669.1.p1 GENE.GFUD01074669.1~~GFUD01074669.1.p1  ORF type:complete len:146 (+),score=54.75 GFUD01074669.1:62-499(+)
MSVTVPTPESLSMDCGLKCDMCNESVNYGDDYIAHLQFAHQIVKNIPFFMDKALKTIKGEKRKIADVGTMLSDLSTASSTGPSSSMQTSFLCPVENCIFSTTKQGMMGGAAASHLSKTHKITGADMKTAAPGKYKFKKVRRETKS